MSLLTSFHSVNFSLQQLNCRSL